MGLVHHHVCKLEQQRVGDQLTQQHTGGHEQDLCISAFGAVQANIVPNRAPYAFTALRCDALRHGDCADAAGLGDGDAAAGADVFVIE